MTNRPDDRTEAVAEALATGTQLLTLLSCWHAAYASNDDARAIAGREVNDQATDFLTALESRGYTVAKKE